MSGFTAHSGPGPARHRGYPRKHTLTVSHRLCQAVASDEAPQFRREIWAPGITLTGFACCASHRCHPIPAHASRPASAGTGRYPLFADCVSAETERHAPWEIGGESVEGLDIAVGDRIRRFDLEHYRRLSGPIDNKVDFNAGRCAEIRGLPIREKVLRKPRDFEYDEMLESIAEGVRLLDQLDGQRSFQGLFCAGNHESISIEVSICIEIIDCIPHFP